MAIQQLTQPILNPIAAFDSTKSQTVSFVVIGGAQVVGNRLVIRNNQTGAIVYNKTQLTMRLDHTIPANVLSNGGYYNAIVYTIDNASNESVASTAVPFYCYSQPALTIDNIPSTETIENGTYSFQGSYIQQEGESLNSYQYILYNSNKEVLSQSSLIYYDSDSSLSYTFVGMSNDTSYYIELFGETVNQTKITSGLKYFTVRYIQPASFAICDLVNNCQDGYIQISSNIVAIDGISNPTPPIYIDDKEVDLTNPDAWVEWNSGFRIQSDFTMRVWGREFTPYEKIITLTNDINSSTTPNRIELKWMIGTVVENLPEYSRISGNNINIINSQNDKIKSLTVGGNSVQLTEPSPVNLNKIYEVGNIKNLINLPSFNITYTQQYYQATNTNFVLKPNYIYTLSFDYSVNIETTDLYYSIGYGTNEYTTDIDSTIQYINQISGRNSVSFIVPSNMPSDSYLWVKFGQTIILADIDVNISNIQLESGDVSTSYQTPNIYNIYLESSSKNLYNYNTPLYLKPVNITYTYIQNGYNINLVNVNQDSYLAIGYRNILNSGNLYTISYNTLGEFDEFKLYTTNKESQEIIEEININNGVFTAPDGLYDLQLVFSIDSSVNTNSLEIWNIQIEASNIVTTYENYESNGAIITLSEPLRGIGKYKDLICLQSPNLLNSDNKSALVDGGKTYYLSQLDTTQYELDFINEDGNKISSLTISSGEFNTPDNCVQVSISNIESSEILTNKIQIELGDETSAYYPFVSNPSIIRYINRLTLDGTETDFTTESIQDYYRYMLPSNAAINTSDILTMSNYFNGINYNSKDIDYTNTVYANGNIGINTNVATTIEDFKTYLSTQYSSGTPVYIDYVLANPVVLELSNENITALEWLNSYSPISNVFTNNEILGSLSLDYVSAYSDQYAQNVYVLLKCWNANSMPYICHSNYIDIPKSTDKIFIWTRRKGNLFDLKIENLGDYSEDDKPSDDTSPVVTIEISPDNVTQTSITVESTAIDETELSTIRFSKDNGNTWDEIIPIDGLSSINTYTFTELTPNTSYNIRVEAIDTSGNIGGISQQVTTKS